MEEIKSGVGETRERSNFLLHRWNVLPRNPNFIGREDKLEQLRSALLQSRFAVCHGLGGVGKTQLVTEYCYQFEAFYQSVLLIPAENAEQIELAYVALGKTAKIIDDKTPLTQAVSKVIAWLSGNPDILVWFENPPDHQTIEPYMPINGTHVVATSRYTEWPTKKILVDIFSPEDSLNYFKKVVGERANFYPEDQIKLLAKTLGHLPLALAQAIAYICETQMSIEEYLDLLETKTAILLSKNLLPEDETHAAVFVTWEVTMDLIRERSFLAPKLLNLCAYLYNSGIPQEVLGRYSTNTENNPQEEFVEEAIGLLRSYSMITTSSADEEVPSVWLHNLVQEVSVARNEKQVQTAWLETVALLYQNDEVSFDRAALEESITFTLNRMLHAKRVVSLAKKLNVSSVPLMRFCIYSTVLNQDMQLLEDELVLANMLPNGVDRLRYKAFAHEAIGLRHFMDVQKSESCFHQALALRLEMQHTEFAWEIMSSYTTLAMLSLVRGDYEGAFDFCENAFDVIQKTKDKKSFSMWITVFIQGAEYLMKKSPDRQRCTKLHMRLLLILLPQILTLGSDLLNQMAATRKWAGSGGSIEYTRGGSFYAYFLFPTIQVLRSKEKMDDHSTALNIDMSQLDNEAYMRDIGVSQSDVEAFKRQFLSFSVTDSLQGTASGISTLLENFIGSEAAPANSGVVSMSSETRGVLTALHRGTKGLDQAVKSLQTDDAETDDTETVKGFINTMGSLADVMGKLPDFYDAQEKHSGAEIPDWQKSIRDLMFKSAKDMLSEKVRELEEMQDDFEELEKTINLDKKIIEEFECALKFVLGASQMLKRSFGAYRQWLVQSQVSDLEDVEAKCEVQEIIEDTFIAPMRALLHKFLTPKRILVFFQGNLDSRPEEFAGLLSQDKERFNMLVEFINEHEKIRQALINALCERNEQLLRERKEGSSSAESEMNAGQAAINDFLYLRVIDNLIFVERNLLRSLKNVSYVLAVFPALQGFELFCARESAQFVATPDSYLVELDVVQQFLKSLQTLTLSFETLRRAFECAPPGVKKSLEGLVSGLLTSVTQFRDMYIALQENDQILSELFLFMVKIQQMRGDTSAVDAIMESFNQLRAFGEQWLFIFSIIKKKFDDVHLPEGLVIVKTDAAIQSTQFYERFVLTFKEVIRQAALIKAILIEFPSKERLPEMLKDSNKACTKVIEEITGVSEGVEEGAEGSDLFEEMDKSDPLYLRAIHRCFRESRRTPQQERERITERYDKCGKLFQSESEALAITNSDCEIIEKAQKNARDAREQKNLEAVISYYEHMMAISPFDSHLSYQLAEFYDVLSRHYEIMDDTENTMIFIKKSEDMFKRSLAISPDGRVLVAYANFLYRLQRFDETLLYVQIVLQLQSEAQQILRFDFLLMNLLPECLHEYIERDGIVEILLGIFARYLGMVCCWQQDNLGKANEMFSQLVHDVCKSQSLVLYFLLAESARLLGQNAAVKKLNAMAYYEQAKQYYEKNKVDEAIICYEKCMLFESDEEDVHHNVACLYHAKGNIDAARKHFELALANPSRALQSEYGFFLVRQNQYQDAIPCFMNTLLAEEDQGSLFYSACDIPTLDESLKKEVEEQGDITLSATCMAYYGIIRCYHMLELKAECEKNVEEFRQYVELSRNPLYWRLLIATYDYVGKPKEAEDCKESLAGIMLSMDTETDARLVGRWGLMPAVENLEADLTRTVFKTEGNNARPKF